MKQVLEFLDNLHRMGVVPDISLASSTGEPSILVIILHGEAGRPVSILVKDAELMVSRVPPV